jgi:hypothetical protein
MRDSRAQDWGSQPHAQATLPSDLQVDCSHVSVYKCGLTGSCHKLTSACSWILSPGVPHLHGGSLTCTPPAYHTGSGIPIVPQCSTALKAATGGFSSLPLFWDACLYCSRLPGDSPWEQGCHRSGPGTELRPLLCTAITWLSVRGLENQGQTPTYSPSGALQGPC